MARRGTQLARRASQRQSSIPRRIKTEQQPKQLEQRQRLFFKQKQQRESLIAKEKALVEKLVSDINAGRISNINQIPQRYRSTIGVSQTDLNNIRDYYVAKREADLWAHAFADADKVISSSDSRAIFIISFSDNPYAKEAYRIALGEQKAYDARKKIIQDVRSGKVTDVKLISGRIINTKTGIPITPTQISKKQYADLINKELPGGDKLVLDRQFNIKAIDSRVLGRSIPFNPRNVEFYAREISKKSSGAISTFFPTGKPRDNIFTRIKLAGKDAFKSPTGKNLVSENVYRQLNLASLLGNKQATETLKKVDAYIPQSEMRAKKIDFQKTQTRYGKFVTFSKRSDTNLNKFYGSAGNWLGKQEKVISRKTGIPLPRIRRDLIAYNKDVLKFIEKKYGVSNDSFRKFDAYLERQKKELNKDIDKQEKLLKKTPPFKIKFTSRGIVLIPNIKSNITNIQYINNTRKFIGLHAVKTINSFGIVIPALVTALTKRPLETIATFPPALWNGLKQDFGKVTSGSGRSLVEVVLEWYLYAKAFRLIGKGLGKVRAGVLRFSPKYKSFVNDKIVIRKPPIQTFARRGSKVLLKERVLKPSIRRPFKSAKDFLKGRKPGQFRRFTKDPGMILKKQSVATGARKLSKQAQLAGQEALAVNTGEKQLLSWIKRRLIIRKPILGSSFKKDYALMIAKDPKNGRRMANILKKFDQGKRLTTKEFADINIWLQKNIAPNITLLERSMYFDPEGGLRISRLKIGAEKTASLRDIFRGNVKFRAGKPMVIVIEKARIAKFPKALKDVAKKLRADKVLTTAETNRLIRWQVQTGNGKFKPIGSTIYSGGTELEITLAPGTWLKKGKTIGFFIEGTTKVPIVLAEVFKPSKGLLARIKLAQAGKLIKAELKALEKLLSKKLGRRIQIETPNTIKKSARSLAREARRYDTRIPIVRLRGKDLTILSRARRSTPRKRTPPRAGRRVTRPVRRTTRRSVRARPRTTRPARTARSARKVAPKRVVRPRPKRPPAKRPRPRPRPKRPPAKRPGKKRPIPRPAQRFRPTKFRKSTAVFYIVVIKRNGKLIRFKDKPMRLNDARDFLAYRLDKGLERTAYFEPLGKAKKGFVPPKTMRGYYSKIRKKLRPFKIRKGKKRSLRNGYIEKRRFGLDTGSEKRSLARSRRGKKRRVVRKKRVTRVTKKKRRVTRKKRRVVRRRPKKRMRVKKRSPRKLSKKNRIVRHRRKKKKR